MTLKQIVSGGQSGVDRAALDAGIELGIPIGGWCPAGRRAEDGPIDPRYPLIETASAEYAIRTEWNVRDSDATLIIYRGELAGGTALTARLAGAYEKPCLVIDIRSPPRKAEVFDWLRDRRIERLNIAGPRASKDEALYTDARLFLVQLLRS